MSESDTERAQRAEAENDGGQGGIDLSGADLRAGGDIVAGDKITAGGDVVGRDKITNISISRSLVQIGTLVIPARFVAALLAAGAVLAFGAWLAFVPAQMPVNTFNIAVAEFGQLDAQGRVASSSDGANLSAWMFGQLRDETRNLPADRPITTWHDSMGLLQKRATIGLVPGDTPEAREKAAAALAKSLNAHVVIYGNLALNQAPATFTPEFYVAELSGEADELLGSQQLGSPIRVRPPIDFNDQRVGEYFNLNLKPRAEALVWFTRGLVYDLNGRHDKALEVFREAEAQLRDWDSAPCIPGQPNLSQGKEVLYYFIGREALFLSDKQDEARQAFGSVDGALAAAEDAFRQALTIRCDYARAYFGLGNVYLQRAQRPIAERRFEPDVLAQARRDADAAIAQQQQALQVAAQSPGSGVEVKAQIALGGGYFAKGNAYLVGGDHAAAVPLFQAAIEAIQKALPSIDPNAHRLLAQTHQSLAGAYYTQGHSQLALGDAEASRSLFTVAIDYYDRCIAQADADIYDVYLQWLKTTHCEPQKNDAAGALADLETND